MWGSRRGDEERLLGYGPHLCSSPAEWSRTCYRHLWASASSFLFCKVQAGERTDFTESRFNALDTRHPKQCLARGELAGVPAGLLLLWGGPDFSPRVPDSQPRAPSPHMSCRELVLNCFILLAESPAPAPFLLLHAHDKNILLLNINKRPPKRSGYMETQSPKYLVRNRLGCSCVHASLWTHSIQSMRRPNNYYDFQIVINVSDISISLQHSNMIWWYLWFVPVLKSQVPWSGACIYNWRNSQF